MGKLMVQVLKQENPDCNFISSLFNEQRNIGSEMRGGKYRKTLTNNLFQREFKTVVYDAWPLLFRQCLEAIRQQRTAQTNYANLGI